MALTLSLTACNKPESEPTPAETTTTETITETVPAAPPVETTPEQPEEETPPVELELEQPEESTPEQPEEPTPSESEPEQPQETIPVEQTTPQQKPVEKPAEQTKPVEKPVEQQRPAEKPVEQQKPADSEQLTLEQQQAKLEVDRNIFESLEKEAIDMGAAVIDDGSENPYIDGERDADGNYSIDETAQHLKENPIDGVEFQVGESGSMHFKVNF